jgi:hypothetical protein
MTDQINQDIEEIELLDRVMNKTAPSGWWIAPALIFGSLAWYLVFKLVIALVEAFMAVI